MRWVRRLTALAAAGLLAGCATLAEPEPPAPSAEAIHALWLAHQQQVAAVTGFELQGRVAVKGAGLSGALRWQQAGDVFNLRIAGPFGAGALSMSGTPALVTIKGKDIDLTTDNPQQVLAERTGWRLPLEALRWWVLGLPAPQAADATPARILLDAEGRALQIQQGDWTLRYSDYRNDTQPVLPYRVEAMQPTPQGEWMATVVIETITPPP